MQDLYLGGYWGPHAQHLRDCATRFLEWIVFLNKSEAAYRQWYVPGQSKEEALGAPFDPTSLNQATGLFNSASQDSISGEVGLPVALWNGSTEDSIGLRCTCGSTAPTLLNSVVVDIPDSLANAQGSSTIKDLVENTARIWECDWIVVASRKSREHRKLTPGKPFADWMLFRRRSLDAPLPAGCASVDMEGGTLVITKPNPVDSRVSDDLDRIRAVESAFGII